MRPQTLYYFSHLFYDEVLAELLGGYVFYLLTLGVCALFGRFAHLSYQVHGGVLGLGSLGDEPPSHFYEHAVEAGGLLVLLQLNHLLREYLHNAATFLVEQVHEHTEVSTRDILVRAQSPSEGFEPHNKLFASELVPGSGGLLASLH